MLSLSVPRTSRSLSPSPTHRSQPATIKTHSANGLARSPDRGEKDMRERSSSICISPRAIIVLCPQLTHSQVVVIKKSWRHVNTKGLTCVLARCFQRLESSCPIASKCFMAANHSLSTQPTAVRTVADHSKFLLQLLDRIIDGDIDIEEIRDVGAQHAKLHSDFGFGAHEVERFQEIFVEVMLKQDGIKQSKETSRAWRILICAMMDLFRDGFDQQLRQFRRKHSFNAHTQYFENIERRASLFPSRKASLNVDPRSNGRKMSDY